MRFMTNIKEVFGGGSYATEPDRGDLVQTIIITAGFAVAALAAVNWISTALLNKAADVAGCVEGISLYDGGTTTSADNCKKQDHAGKDGKSFEDDSAYQSRFGGGGSDT